MMSLCCAFSLTACGSDDPLPAEKAVGHYESFVDDLTRALTTDGKTWSHEERTPRADLEDGICRYTPGAWSRTDSLPDPPDEGDWQQRMDVANPVFEKHGFTTVEDTSQKGSKTFLRSVDEHGAKIELDAYGHIWLMGAAVDADPCTLEVLGRG